MKRLHWSTLLGAVLMGAATLAAVGPITAAVVMLRCCSDSTGPTWGAWAALLLTLTLVVAFGALLGGLLAWLVRWVVRGRGSPGAG